MTRAEEVYDEIMQPLRDGTASDLVAHVSKEVAVGLATRLCSDPSETELGMASATLVMLTAERDYLQFQIDMVE